MMYVDVDTTSRLVEVLAIDKLLVELIPDDGVQS